MASIDCTTDAYVTADGMRIRYRRSGSGPVMVLLHGTTSSLEHFVGLAPLLEPHWDVIRLDLPGFGFTGPRPGRDYRISTYASTVSKFLEALDIERFALLGNSLGGAIAWQLALQHPDRLTGLVLVNATGYPTKRPPRGIDLARKPWIRPILRRWLPRRSVKKNLREAVGPDSTIVDDIMIDRVHNLWSRPGNKSAFVDFVNTEQIDRTHCLREIRTPTLVLTSASMRQNFAADIPRAVEAVHPGGGHLLPEEDPHWVASAVSTFFDTDDRIPG